MDHLALIAVMAFAAMGMWVAMGDDMILGWWRRIVEWHEKDEDGRVAKYHAPKWLRYPLASCPRCMVTLYGTAAILALGWPFDLVQWLVYIPCAVGLQELMQR